jgi:hypothetical protein
VFLHSGSGKINISFQASQTTFFEFNLYDMVPIESSYNQDYTIQDFTFQRAEYFTLLPQPNLRKDLPNASNFSLLSRLSCK